MTCEHMKVTVVMAVLNGRNTVTNALDSVLNQIGIDLDLVVIDGGSTDGTLELLHAYENRLSVLVSEPDSGIYDALNKGIRCACGEIIGFLHSDDVYANELVLRRVIEAFSDPEVDAVYGDLLYVANDNTERVVRYWRAGKFSLARLAWGWMPPHPTFYVRRSAYEQLGLFDTALRIAADYDFMLRFLGRCGVSAVYIPEVLVKMRVGGSSNRSIPNVLRKTLEDYRALRTNGIGGIGALAWKNLTKLQQFVLRPGKQMKN